MIGKLCLKKGVAETGVVGSTPDKIKTDETPPVSGGGMFRDFLGSCAHTQYIVSGLRPREEIKDVYFPKRYPITKFPLAYRCFWVNGHADVIRGEKFDVNLNGFGYRVADIFSWNLKSQSRLVFIHKDQPIHGVNRNGEPWALLYICRFLHFGEGIPAHFERLGRYVVCSSGLAGLKSGNGGVSKYDYYSRKLGNGLVFPQPWEGLLAFFGGVATIAYAWLALRGFLGWTSRLSDAWLFMYLLVGAFAISYGTFSLLCWMGDRIDNESLYLFQDGYSFASKIGSGLSHSSKTPLPAQLAGPVRLCSPLGVASCLL